MNTPKTTEEKTNSEPASGRMQRLVRSFIDRPAPIWMARSVARSMSKDCGKLARRLYGIGDKERGLEAQKWAAEYEQEANEL